MAKPDSSEPDSGFWYDADAAERAVAFFAECIRHTTGEWRGQPFVLSDWQADRIVRPLFGWKRADGTRRYRTCFVFIPRKAGKTTLAAGLALYALYCDGEPGAQVINAAADREQARLCFDAAKQMVEMEGELSCRSEVYKNSIVTPDSGSSYRVLSSDAYTKHGLNCHFIGADELHCWPGRDLWDTLTTSTGARRQPLTVVTTTAGFDKHSLCYELYDYAKKVEAGIIEDPSFLPVLFEAGENDDWKDPATWHKAHPGLGISVKLDYFEAECAKAQATPAYENTFRRLLLNQWTEQDSRWLGMDDWDACKGELPNLEHADCFAGLDLASTTDITALVLTFAKGDKLIVVPHFWIPSDRIRDRVRRDRVPYDVWVAEGLVTATDGAVTDYDRIRADIHLIAERYRIREIAFDRWNATQLATQLQGDGFAMVGFGQGFASMSGPTKELERRILGRELLHDGNPVLRWMVSNVTVSQDPAGNLKPDKAKSTERIDGVVAAVMGIGRYMVAEAPAVDPYAKRGLILI
jgi:phage terminase large subunit-like protein